MCRCRERLTEQVAERLAAGGGGVFFPVSRGSGVVFKKGNEAHLPRRQCRWRRELM